MGLCHGQPQAVVSLTNPMHGFSADAFTAQACHQRYLSCNNRRTFTALDLLQVGISCPVGCRTVFLSAHGQFIVPTIKEPRPDTRACSTRTSSVRRQSAARGSWSPDQPPLAASLPAKEVGALLRAPTLRLLTGSVGRKRPRKTPQPFRSCSPGHHSRLVADGSRLPCRARPTTLVSVAAMSEPSPGPPLALPRKFYSGHSPTLRLLAVRPPANSSYRSVATIRSRWSLLVARVSATSTLLTRQGTGLPTPEATVLPALASVSDSKVTSLGRVTARSAWVCAAFRLAILSRLAMRARFPPTKTEARGIAPIRMFTVRHRLLKVSLASPPLPIRLGLSWLSFSPSSV